MTRAANSLIGADIERREDLRFLRGRGTYVGDLRRSNALHAVVLRNSVAHGRILSMSAEPSPNNPLGAKGAGEGGIIPVAGVIGNAVAAALESFGVEPRHLPLSPARVWQLVEASRCRRAHSSCA